MSNTKIWVHAVWGTGRSQPILKNGLREVFTEYLMTSAAHMDVEVSLVNCWIDHVHCLIRLKPAQTVDEVVRMIKGETAQWINRLLQAEKRFTWSRNYYAASVSEGNLNGVKSYIFNQEWHHAHRTYNEEVTAFFSTASPQCLKEVQVMRRAGVA